MEIDAEGQTHYKVAGVKKAGTYLVPVSFEYNNGYDRIVKEKRIVKFTVMDAK